MQHNRQSLRNTTRHGTLLPAIAIALLVAAGGIALVLNQLWLSAAQRELQGAADAAALAAAQAMTGEHLLLVEYDSEEQGRQVRQQAATVARRFRAAGQPIAVNPAPQQDVRCGRQVMNQRTGHTSFVETDRRPTSVIVRTHCDQQNGNPVALFMPYLTGQPTADLVAQAEASVSNQISGVRPLNQANVPAWPLAILESQGGALGDWLTNIEARTGDDVLSWDAESRQVKDESDGLPELVLRTGTRERPGNVCLVDLGTQLHDQGLREQLREGWSWRQLQEFGSELSFAQGPMTAAASSDFSGMPSEELLRQIGQSRIVLLYERLTPFEPGTVQPVQLTRLVAIRLLRATRQGEELELVVQPSIVSTRTAVLSRDEDRVLPNPYIYRMAITN